MKNKLLAISLIALSGALIGSETSTPKYRFSGKEAVEYLRATGECERCDLSGQDLKDAIASFALTHRFIRLAGANLSGADLSDVDLWNANLSGANLTDARLTDTRLVRANLSGANLTRANCAGADLTDANLTNAKLAFANFRSADLTNPQFCHTDFSNANLSGAFERVRITKEREAYIKEGLSESEFVRF